ncbi:MAG: SPASM domain-containing protein, partial [Anaerolineaceae bacterium]|nr:SPASM domain-containing protein [Anaerolineaceae bacterium]
VPGSFGETVANVRLAVEQGIAVALSAVLTHQSCHEVDAIVDLGQRLGVQHVAFNRYIGPPLPSVEPSPSELRRAIGRIERRIQDADPVQYGECIPPCFEANSSSGCLAGVTQASIDPWGNVHPCTHSPVIIGSLHEASMAELWQGEALAAWRSAIPEGCADCAAYATCHGGCKAMPGRGDPLRRRPLSAPAAACRPPGCLPAYGHGLACACVPRPLATQSWGMARFCRCAPKRVP